MATQLKVISKMDTPGMDRQKALEAALAQIDRAFGKGSAMKLGSREAMQIESISTGSLGLDIALGIGGLPRGRAAGRPRPARRRGRASRWEWPGPRPPRGCRGA